MPTKLQARQIQAEVYIPNIQRNSSQEAQNFGSKDQPLRLDGTRELKMIEGISILLHP